MSLKLVSYPDPILSQAVPEGVYRFGHKAKVLGKKMLKLMKRNRGVGLSAPQVGIAERIIVINTTGKPQHNMICLNPRIESVSDEVESEREGCLSLMIDGEFLRGHVERHKRITATFMETDGTERTMDCKGFLARVFQHEIDQLNGIQILDRWSESDIESHRESLAEMTAIYKGI